MGATRKLNESVVPARKDGACCYCGRTAQHYSLTFMAHICSVRCEDAYVDEYFGVTMIPETLKEYKEAFEFIRNELNKERRLRVEAEHQLEELQK